MAEYCRTIFGDALLIDPLEKYPVRPISSQILCYPSPSLHVHSHITAFSSLPNVLLLHWQSVDQLTTIKPDAVQFMWYRVSPQSTKQNAWNKQVIEMHLSLDPAQRSQQRARLLQKSRHVAAHTIYGRVWTYNLQLRPLASGVIHCVGEWVTCKLNTIIHSFMKTATLLLILSEFGLCLFRLRKHCGPLSPVMLQH